MSANRMSSPRKSLEAPRKESSASRDSGNDRQFDAYVAQNPRTSNSPHRWRWVARATSESIGRVFVDGLLITRDLIDRARYSVVGQTPRRINAFAKVGDNALSTKRRYAQFADVGNKKPARNRADIYSRNTHWPAFHAFVDRPLAEGVILYESLFSSDRSLAGRPSRRRTPKTPRRKPCTLLISVLSVLALAGST